MRRYAAKLEVDPLSEADALQEAQLLPRASWLAPPTPSRVGRLLALGACPRQIQDTIKDLYGSNLPVWAPFAVLGGLIVALLIPEVAGPLLESIFGAAAEDGSVAAGDATSSASSVRPAVSELNAGRSAGVRVAESPEMLDNLFGELSRGGAPVESSYPGKIVELPD